MANLRSTLTQLRVNCPDIASDIDALEPMQSQYAASPRILSLLVRKAAILDPGRDIMAWYDACFNPKTAQGVGLDVWGRIVGAGRMLWVENADFFGFAFQQLENFDQAPFWNGATAAGQFPLSDEAFRALVFYKAAGNISGSTMEDLNALLSTLFEQIHGSGSCFIIEPEPMQIRAIFSFYLSRYESAIFSQYGLFGRPAGVGFSWYQHDPAEMFGFAGQNLQNFDHGVFTPHVYQTAFPETVFGFAGQRLQSFDHGGFVPAVQIF